MDSSLNTLTIGYCATVSFIPKCILCGHFFNLWNTILTDEVIILFLCTVPCYLKCCNFPSCQIIVPAMGFDIVIICPAFEDICWVSDVNDVRLCQSMACSSWDIVYSWDYYIVDVSHLYIMLAPSCMPPRRTLLPVLPPPLPLAYQQVGPLPLESSLDC